MKLEKIETLHKEHTEWLNCLAFYADEIGLMKKHIGMVAERNTNKEILGRVDHFENQLIIQKNNIDELKHDVNDHESYLEHRTDENPILAGKRKVHDHPVLRERMERFEQGFNALRKELLEFMGKAL